MMLDHFRLSIPIVGYLLFQWLWSPILPLLWNIHWIIMSDALSIRQSYSHRCTVMAIIVSLNVSLKRHSLERIIQSWEFQVSLQKKQYYWQNKKNLVWKRQNSTESRMNVDVRERLLASWLSDGFPQPWINSSGPSLSLLFVSLLWNSSKNTLPSQLDSLQSCSRALFITMIKTTIVCRQEKNN